MNENSEISIKNYLFELILVYSDKTLKSLNTRKFCKESLLKTIDSYLFREFIQELFHHLLTQSEPVPTELDPLEDLNIFV